MILLKKKILHRRCDRIATVIMQAKQMSTQKTNLPCANPTTSNTQLIESDVYFAHLLQQFAELNDAKLFFEDFYLGLCNQHDKSIVFQKIAQFEKIVNLFGTFGYKNICDVYQAVKQHATINFAKMHRFQVCAISGVLSKNMLALSSNIYVHEQYEKFVTCLWTVLHIKQIEKNRKNNKQPIWCKQNKIGSVELTTEQSEIYRQSILVVLQNFCVAYRQMITQKEIISVRVDMNQNILEVLKQQTQKM